MPGKIETWKSDIMAKKALSIWLFSSLTVIASAHLIDASSSLLFGTPIHLLQFYPLINQQLDAVTPLLYFWASAATVFILWGIVCAITFDNPVETFLNKILSEAKTQGAVETQMLENKSEIFDAMYEIVETNNESLAHVSDMVCNVRADVKDLRTVREKLDKLEDWMSEFKTELKRLNSKISLSNICPSCGQPIMPEFNMCPYCGEDVRPNKPPILNLQEFK